MFYFGCFIIFQFNMYSRNNFILRNLTASALAELRKLLIYKFIYHILGLLIHFVCLLKKKKIMVWRLMSIFGRWQQFSLGFRRIFKIYVVGNCGISCILIDSFPSVLLSHCKGLLFSRFNLNRYIMESRNLKKVNRIERRLEMLHVGRAEIVRFLNTLPKTQHDLTSFTVDLTVFTVSMKLSLDVWHSTSSLVSVLQRGGVISSGEFTLCHCNNVNTS